jgi:DNA-binding transcriptional MerR regulator
MSASSKSPNAFRTISEVADTLGVQQHVLRFWETKFTAVKPLKRGGNRRYYRAEDVALLRAINRLLYTEGYTIRGVQKLLEQHGPAELAARYGGTEGPGHAAGQQRADQRDPDELATAESDGTDEMTGAESAAEDHGLRAPDDARNALPASHRAELLAIRRLLAEGLERTG